MAESREQGEREREQRVRAQPTTQAHLRLAAIVESSDDAIIGKDVNGIITDWNNGAERIFGYSADEVIGKPISLLVPSDHVNDSAEIMRKIRGGEVVRHFETTRQKKDGTRIEVSLTISPILDTEGRVVGAATISRDISEHRRAEKALRESEERFRLVANAAPVMIWMSGVDKLCTYFNQGWLEFTGRSLEEELGNRWAEGVHPDDLAPCLETYAQAFDRREPFQMQYRLRRHDREYRWIFDRGVPRFEAEGVFAGYIGSCIDITDRKLAEQALAGMSRKLLEAQEQERARVGRELHDDINQRLALLAVEIQRMKGVAPATYGELRSRMDELGKRTSEISAVVQSLSHELHSSRLEYLGLVSAMKGFCKEFGEKHKVEIAFGSEGMPSGLPSEISLCLFRVMQEGLQNALKHSGVRLFEVRLHGSPVEIQLTIRDSGVGFDPDLAKDTKGLGLISMRERVRLVKGTFLIASRPRSGTEINVRVSLSAGTPTRTD